MQAESRDLRAELATAAAEWFALGRAGTMTAAQSEAFAEWLADSGHRQAYDAICQLWAGLGALGDDPGLASLRQAALEALDAAPRVAAGGT